VTDLGTFTCAVCNETFDKIRSEEEVREEYERIFPFEAAHDVEKDTVCGPCYDKVMAEVAPGLGAPYYCPGCKEGH